MSFGWSANDLVALSKLCYQTVQNARKACGEYDSLTQEVSSLHGLFMQLEKEKNIPESVLNKPDDSCRSEVEAVVSGCKKDLLLLEKLLNKYNALGAEQGGFRKLRHKVRFGNGKMADLPLLRAKITYYNSILHTQLQLVSMQSAARIERSLQDTGGELDELKKAIENLSSRLVKTNSPLTPFLNDDVAVWKTFRRELLRAGYSSSQLQRYGERIRKYCEQLVMDERLARSSLNSSTACSTPKSVDSGIMIFYTPKESFQHVTAPIMPPAIRTVEPESILEDAIAGPQPQPFKLPPPALPIDHDEPLVAKDLSPGGALSLVELEASVEASSRGKSSRGESPGLTPSDIMFNSVFGRRRIPRVANKRPPITTQAKHQPSSYLATKRPTRDAVSNNTMLQRFLHHDIVT